MPKLATKKRTSPTARRCPFCDGWRVFRDNVCTECYKEYPQNQNVGSPANTTA